MARKNTDYFKDYYKEHRKSILIRSQLNYQNNREKRREQQMGYRETEGYKKIKKQCDERIKEQRHLSSEISNNAGILGNRYTEEEDHTIILYKECYKEPYRVVAKLLNRSMKGVEYRYNLLRKKREEGDDTIPCYLAS